MPAGLGTHVGGKFTVVSSPGPSRPMPCEAFSSALPPLLRSCAERVKPVRAVFPTFSALAIIWKGCPLRVRNTPPLLGSVLQFTTPSSTCSVEAGGM